MGLVAAWASGACLVASCSKEEPPSGSTPIGTGDYRGLLATADGLAVVDLSVRDPSVAAKAGSGTLLSVAGTLTFDGKVVGVSGSLDGTTATVTGGGYSLTGTLGDGVLDLTMTGPSGTSSFSVFTGGSTITLHCGLYEGAKKGPIGVAIAGSRAAGAIGLAGGGKVLIGSTSGASFVLPGFPPAGKMEGTISGIAMDGTWSDGAGGTGTFNGTSAKCPRGTATGDSGTDAPIDTGSDTGTSTDTGATDVGGDTGSVDTGGTDTGSDSGGACSSLALTGLAVTEGTFAGSDDTVYTGGTVLEGTYVLNARKRTPFEAAPAGLVKITMRFTKKAGGGAQDFLYERVVSDNGVVTSESGEITFGVPPFTGGSVGTNGYKKKVACPATISDNSIQYSVPGAGTLVLKWYRGTPSGEIYGGWEEFKKS